MIEMSLRSCAGIVLGMCGTDENTVQAQGLIDSIPDLMQELYSRYCVSTTGKQRYL